MSTSRSKAEKRGQDSTQAIYDGCWALPAIMMTTMAPLWAPADRAGARAGAERAGRLGLAVVGGLLFSQLLTLKLRRSSISFRDEMEKARGWRRAGEKFAGQTGSGGAG